MLNRSDGFKGVLLDAQAKGNQALTALNHDTAATVSIKTEIKGVLNLDLTGLDTQIFA